MSQCKTARTQDTTDICGNPIVPPPLPLNDVEQQRAQSPLNRAFSDKFLMVFDVPKCIRASNQSSSRECNQISLDQMQFNIFGTVVPNVTLATVAVPFHGHTPKIAGHSRGLEPMSVNYFVDNTFANYWIMWKWADLIIGSHSSKAGGEQSADRYNILLRDYSTNISIIGLDGYNKPMIEWIYKGCILSSVGGIQYNYQTQNEITSTFTFEYSFLDCTLR